MNRLLKRVIDRRLAAREGKRFSAFYRGASDCRTGRPGNPFPPGSEESGCWEDGWQYAESEKRKSVTPLCRFGPGGEFMNDWPRERS